MTLIGAAKHSLATGSRAHRRDARLRCTPAIAPKVDHYPLARERCWRMSLGKARYRVVDAEAKRGVVRDRMATIVNALFRSIAVRASIRCFGPALPRKRCLMWVRRAGKRDGSVPVGPLTAANTVRRSGYSFGITPSDLRRFSPCPLPKQRGFAHPITPQVCCSCQSRHRLVVESTTMRDSRHAAASWRGCPAP